MKDVKKISIQFTIVKNITAETGNKTLYIRIAKPDNDILTKSEANTFAYEDRNIGYSIKNTSNTPEKNKPLRYTGMWKNSFPLEITEYTSLPTEI